MKNNTRQNYGKENRNFQDEPQRNNFKKSKLKEDFDEDFLQKGNKGLHKNTRLYNELNHFPKENRRSYTSVFDI